MLAIHPVAAGPAMSSIAGKGSLRQQANLDRFQAEHRLHIPNEVVEIAPMSLVQLPELLMDLGGQAFFAGDVTVSQFHIEMQH